MTAPNEDWAAICPCGKRIYRSRKLARRAAKAIRGRGTGHLNAYLCSTTGNGWHLGHLPTAVLQGDISRAVIVQKTRMPGSQRNTDRRSA